MKKTKILTGALLLSALFLSACGETAQLPTETEQAGAKTTSAAIAETGPVETEAMFSDALPELDFGGETVNVIAWGFEDVAGEFYAENENGEIINDAVFRRNQAVDERLNTAMNLILIDSEALSEVTTKVIRTVKAGDAEYDLMAATSVSAAYQASKGYFRNLLETPHLDLSMPYWSQGYNESISVGDAQYLCTGSPAISLYRYMYVTAYNNALFAQYDLDSLIPVVKDGKWTLDYQHALCKDIYTDLNGNGEADDADLYGFVGGARTSVDTYWVNANVHLFARDDDNYYVFSPEVDRYDATLNKLLKLYYDGTGSYIVPNADDGVRETYIQTIFGEGRAVMATTHLYGIEHNLREMKDEFTIVPMPKLDEAQENYRTAIQDQFTSFAIPATVPDTKWETVGAYLECLGAASYSTVFNAYFETALSYKYLQNSESVDMLHLIFDTAYIDPSAIYYNEVGGLVTPLRNMVAKKENTITSSIEKIQSGVLTKLDKMNNAFRDIRENQ